LPDESVALPADRLNAATIPARIVASWNTVSTRWNPVALIVGAWAVLTLPLVFFRGLQFRRGSCRRYCANGARGRLLAQSA